MIHGQNYLTDSCETSSAVTERHGRAVSNIRNVLGSNLVPPIPAILAEFSVSLSLDRKMLCQCLKIVRAHFLPQQSQFLIRKQSCRAMCCLTTTVSPMKSFLTNRQIFMKFGAFGGHLHVGNIKSLSLMSWTRWNFKVKASVFSLDVGSYVKHTASAVQVENSSFLGLLSGYQRFGKTYRLHLQDTMAIYSSETLVINRRDTSSLIQDTYSMKYI